MADYGFICPICGKALKKENSALKCSKGHSFDLAKEGYAHLLPVQKMHTKIPGDSKEMVDARARFLEAGYYDIFAEALAELCIKEARKKKTPLHILDMGCGEGYYSRFISKRLNDCKIDFQLLGIDIAKPAVKRAAKKAPEQCRYAVASCFACPVEDSWSDIAINVFAPFAKDETLRVLKPNGKFIYAVPGPKHLFGLKKILYETPYENPVQNIQYKGFTDKGSVDTEENITVSGQMIQDLFCMTPYYWKTPKEGSSRLSECEEINTPIQFRFLQFTKA